MSNMNVRLEAWINRRAVETIRTLIREGELGGEFSFDRSVVYRIPLPDEPEVDASLSASGQSCSFVRSWLEGLGFGCRVYLIDAQPMALFDRPLGLVILNAFGANKVFTSLWTGNLTLNERAFPLFDPGVLEGCAIHNRGLCTQWLKSPFAHDLWWSPPPQIISGPPFHGPWPTTDVPLPGSDPLGGGYVPTAPPALGPNEPPPTFLFYGICFQGYSDIKPLTNQRIDPLWDETLKVAGGFAQRGYRSRSSYAGGPGLDFGLRADTFDVMVQSLDRDVPATFCNSPKDQMVIYIAAHGCGGQYNPTGQTAMHWETASRRTSEWIKHPDFWQKLRQNSAVIRNHPEKVYVLVESCRSGGLIGARPTELSSTKLLSAAPDENTLVNANEFSHCIRSSIANPRVDTWQKFIEAVKYCLRVSGGSTQPKNA